MNNTYPGRPDYVGPSKGFFGYVHHDTCVEWSDDIFERVEYITHVKPPYQRRIRLYCLCYLSCPELEEIADIAMRPQRRSLAEFSAAWDHYLSLFRKQLPSLKAQVAKLISDVPRKDGKLDMELDFGPAAQAKIEALWETMEESNVPL